MLDPVSEPVHDPSSGPAEPLAVGCSAISRIRSLSSEPGRTAPLRNTTTVTDDTIVRRGEPHKPPPPVTRPRFAKSNVVLTPRKAAPPLPPTAPPRPIRMPAPEPPVTRRVAWDLTVSTEQHGEPAIAVTTTTPAPDRKSNSRHVHWEDQQGGANDRANGAHDADPTSPQMPRCGGAVWSRPGYPIDTYAEGDNDTGNSGGDGSEMADYVAGDADDQDLERRFAELFPAIAAKPAATAAAEPTDTAEPKAAAAEPMPAGNRIAALGAAAQESKRAREAAGEAAAARAAAARAAEARAAESQAAEAKEGVAQSAATVAQPAMVVAQPAVAVAAADGAQLLAAMQTMQAQLAQAQATMHAQSSQIDTLSQLVAHGGASPRGAAASPHGGGGGATSFPLLSPGRHGLGSPAVAVAVGGGGGGAWSSPRPNGRNAVRLQQAAREEAALSLERVCRGHLARRRLHARAAAVVAIQAACRRRRAVATLARARDAATRLQATQRRRRARRSLAEARHAATVVQAAQRRSLARRRFVATRHAARAVQRLLRGKCARLLRASKRSLQRRLLAADSALAAATAALGAQRQEAERHAAHGASLAAECAELHRQLHTSRVTSDAAEETREAQAQQAEMQAQQAYEQARAEALAQAREEAWEAQAEVEQAAQRLAQQAEQAQGHAEATEAELQAELQAARSARAQFAGVYFSALHATFPAALPVPGEMLPGGRAGASGFVWRISSFAALGDDAVSSPPFAAFGGEWSLWVYPRGYERPDRLSIFLHGKKSNRAATVVYHLGLLRPEGRPVVSRRSGGACFGEPDKCSSPTASLTWGVRAMVDLHEVHEPAHQFLHDGCLTVYALIESVEPEEVGVADGGEDAITLEMPA